MYCLNRDGAAEYPMMTRHTDDPSAAPLVLSWDEFAQRLRKAGWTEAQIEKHIQEIAEDNESGE
jgi:hypothetical protein